LPLCASQGCVSLTSGTHRASDIHFDDIQYQHRPYDKWEAYGQSKTAEFFDKIFMVFISHFDYTYV
jgi:hypothetical protein